MVETECSSWATLAYVRISGLSPLFPRVALYSILTAIEEDLRTVLISHVDPEAADEALGAELAARASDRAERDLGARPRTFAELLAYVDFADAWQLVSRHADKLPPAWGATCR